MVEPFWRKKLVQSPPPLRVNVVSDGVPPNVTEAVMLVFFGARAMTSSSNVLVTGLDTVAVTEFVSVSVSVAPLVLAMCQVPSFTGEPEMSSVSPAPNPADDHDAPLVRMIWSPPPDRR